MSYSWYEVLSVLHLMSMMLLSQADSLLFHKTSSDGYQTKIYHDGLAVHQVLPQIPPELRFPEELLQFQVM